MELREEPFCFDAWCAGKEVATDSWIPYEYTARKVIGYWTHAEALSRVTRRRNKIGKVTWLIKVFMIAIVMGYQYN